MQKIVAVIMAAIRPDLARIVLAVGIPVMIVMKIVVIEVQLVENMIDMVVLQQIDMVPIVMELIDMVPLTVMVLTDMVLTVMEPTVMVPLIVMVVIGKIQ